MKKQYIAIIEQLKIKLAFIEGYNSFVRNGLSGFDQSKNDWFQLGFGVAQLRATKKH